MIFLTCSSKLATLRRLLTHSFPESLKVCGALHHVIHENPFRLQVLVDQWPDVTSVICRPALEEMTDPMDHYTNTYFIFSKDTKSLRQMLKDPQTVNWNQVLQIQGCQAVLGQVLQEISSKHGSRMETTSNLLYMRDGIESEKLEKINTLSSDELQFTPLLIHEAPIVNNQWVSGKNERSLHYIERCIQNFSTICARRKGLDKPIAWALTEQSVEIRMGYTEPAYRNLGIASSMLLKLGAVSHKRRAPIYVHVADDNTSSQSSIQKAGYRLCGKWLQWAFQQQILNA